MNSFPTFRKREIRIGDRVIVTKIDAKTPLGRKGVIELITPDKIYLRIDGENYHLGPLGFNRSEFVFVKELNEGR